MSIPRIVPELQASAPWGRDSMTEESVDADSSDVDSPPPPEFVPHPSPYRACTAAAFADINQALATRSLRASVNRGPYGASPQRRYSSQPASQSPPRPPDAPESDTSAARAPHLSTGPQHPQPTSRPEGRGRSKSLPLFRLKPRKDQDEGSRASKGNRTVLKPWTVRRFQRTSGPPELSEEKDRQDISHMEGRDSGGGKLQEFAEGHLGPAQDRKTRKRRAATCIIM